MSEITTTPGGKKKVIKFAEGFITPDPGGRSSRASTMEAQQPNTMETEVLGESSKLQQATNEVDGGSPTNKLDKEEMGDQESGQESEDTSLEETQSDIGEEEGGARQSRKPRGSALKNKQATVSRCRTRFLFGIPPADKGKMVEEALGALKDLFSSVVKVGVRQRYWNLGRMRIKEKWRW
jgi:hypothetical protein